MKTKDHVHDKLESGLTYALWA